MIISKPRRRNRGNVVSIISRAVFGQARPAREPSTLFGLLVLAVEGSGGAPGVADTGGGGLLAAPATPTLTLISGASDNTPNFTLDGDLVVGDTIRFQYSTDSGFSGASEITNTIDAGEDAANEIAFTTGALADGTWYFRARIERTGHTNSAWSNSQTETIDTTAPTLSSPTGTKTGSTTADLSVSTNEGNGTVYGVVVASADTAPSAAQIIAGHNQAGTAAVFAHSQGVIATGAQTMSATGLSSGTAYKSYYAQVDAAGNTSSASGSSTFTTDAGSFAGLGDVVGSALAHWGLQAYNAAYATGSNPAIDVTKASDGSVDTTINILSDGTLDVATITGLGYAVKVKKIYDQTGNANHLTQATLANMPDLTTGSLNGHPVMTFSGSQRLTKSALSSSPSQPWSMLAVAKRSSGTAFAGVLAAGGDTLGLFFGTSGHVDFFANSDLSVTGISENAWHSIIGCALGGSSSQLSIDGSTTTGSAGNAALTGVAAVTLGNDTSNEALTGTIEEAAIWPSDISGSIAALVSNITARLGTF